MDERRRHMFKELVYVEQEECPLDTLAGYDEEELAKKRVMFDQSCIERFQKTADYFLEEQGFILISWDETDDIPETDILLELTIEGCELILASAPYIAFKEAVKDSDRILMFTMK